MMKISTTISTTKEREGKESILLSILDCYNSDKSRYSRWFGTEGRISGSF